MLVSPQSSHVEILTASVMAFRGGAFGWWLGHESAALVNRISALIKETRYSCLGNPMDRGAWRAAVHGATKSQTWLLATKQRKRPQRAPSSLLPCGHLCAWQWALTRLWLSWCRDLGLQPQNWEKQMSVVYNPPSLWASVTADGVTKTIYIHYELHNTVLRFSNSQLSFEEMIKRNLIFCQFCCFFFSCRFQLLSGVGVSALQPEIFLFSFNISWSANC